MSANDKAAQDKKIADRLRAENEDMGHAKDKADEIAQGLEGAQAKGGKKTDVSHGDKSKPHSNRVQ